MKRWIVFISLLWMTTATAQLIESSFDPELEIPIVPKDCFKEQAYCTESKALGIFRGGVRTKVFASFDQDLFGEVPKVAADSILKKYMDFNRWPEYVGDEQDDLKFIKSVNRSTGNIIRHYAHYFTKAPRPYGKMEIIELALYQNKSGQYSKAVASWSFDLDSTFNSVKGVKSKKGWLHILHDEEKEKYILIATVDVIPSVDLLPGVAKKYISKSIEVIFTGIFRDELDD